VIPLDMITEMGGLHKMARFSRITKIYKLIRMTRFVRLVKVVKIKNIFVRHLADLLKVGLGVERLMYMLITFFVLQHIVACIL
jgi:hypothetical protein